MMKFLNSKDIEEIGGNVSSSERGEFADIKGRRDFDDVSADESDVVDELWRSECRDDLEGLGRGEPARDRSASTWSKGRVETINVKSKVHRILERRRRRRRRRKDVTDTRDDGIDTITMDKGSVEDVETETIVVPSPEADLDGAAGDPQALF